MTSSWHRPRRRPRKLQALLNQADALVPSRRGRFAKALTTIGESTIVVQAEPYVLRRADKVTQYIRYRFYVDGKRAHSADVAEIFRKEERL